MIIGLFLEEILPFLSQKGFLYYASAALERTEFTNAVDYVLLRLLLCMDCRILDIHVVILESGQ